jgi:hypothetical protein
MFGCKVFFFLVQADDSVVRIRIFLARMFSLTAAKSVLAYHICPCIEKRLTS